MARTLSAVVFFLLIVTSSHPAFATSFTTIFGPGGAAGSQPDPSVLNGLDGFTQFNGGEILFFQNGSFYVGGAGPATGNPLSAQGLENFGGTPQINNRGFGVTGADTANINFTSGIVQEVTLQVRGTSTQDSIGPGPTPTPTTFPFSTALDNADGMLQVFTNLGLQLTIDIDNTGYAPLTLNLGGIFDGQTLNGSSITQLSLINNGPTNSVVALGELTVEAVPEPATVLLFGSGLIGLGLWGLRNRRQV